MVSLMVSLMVMGQLKYSGITPGIPAGPAHLVAGQTRPRAKNSYTGTGLAADCIG